MNGRPCTDVGQARPDNLQAAFRNTHRQSSQMLAQQGVTGQQLDLLIVVLPDANASVCYGKQVKWLSKLVVFVGYFFMHFC
jgi:eukaryotic translation initiation factor 2C